MQLMIAPAASALILNNQDDSKATGQPAKLLVNNAFAWAQSLADDSTLKDT